MEPVSSFFKIEKDPVYQKGIDKSRLEIAKEMKKDGLSVAQIAKFTKLSVQEIEKL